ncbi:taurine dioxygenase [Novosphingobium sp. CF614]|uniref:TauD/TfdA dioxygenase family protein n=1 Tax=Novosphingobium sp. CF614 TaxID=1884364 RepID=UPI0008E37854|nr:TauD/TfdA family dioxygenase [Novosphingobium sp. CF614]SFF85314.1 taurine dioxygenase [Novosphingobium sp. CF614]
MTHLEVRELSPEFGVEVLGFDPKAPLDDATREQLRDLFDTRRLLLFRDIDLSHEEQARLCTMLIRKGEAETIEAMGSRESFISNKLDDGIAPFGRLQFHGDTMWADKPYQVLSLYGTDVQQPAAPTIFVDAVGAWKTLPEDLRRRAEGREVLQTAGAVRRGNMSGVLLTEVENPPSTVTRINYTHPRTGETVLHICEQMTRNVLGMSDAESEDLLTSLFAHLYQPERQVGHDWREGDLVVFDNIALQHSRARVSKEGPARTLRKVASPMPRLRPDQLPRWKAEAA